TPTMAQAAPPVPVKNKKTKSVIVTLAFVVMIGVIGTLGYLYYTTNNSLEKKAQELASTHQETAKHREASAKHEAVATFITEQNNESLSRQLCGGTPVGMFDVHL